MLSDANALGEKLKTPHFKESVMSEIAAIVEKRPTPRDIDREIERRLGKVVGRIVRHVLNSKSEDSFEFAKALLEAGASKESIDFLGELAGRYGYFFTKYRSFIDFPESIDTMSGDVYYDPLRGLVFNMVFRKREEVFRIEATPENLVDTAHAILRLVSEGYEAVKKDVPSVELEVSKRNLKKVRKYTQKIESSLK